MILRNLTQALGYLFLSWEVGKEFDVPEKNLRVILAPSDVASGTISVQIRNTSQDADRGLAKRIVDDLFDERLLEFAHHITEAVAPEPGSPLSLMLQGMKHFS